MNKKVVTECVGYGHPDKLADFISDSILTEYLKIDKNTRAGIEVMVKDNIVVLGGEITSNAYINIDNVVRNCFNEIRYPLNHHLESKDIKIINLIGNQSLEIRSGVVKSDDNIGAGDQGFVVGFASSETNCYLPLGVYASRVICDEMNKINNIGPDLKSQVIIKYINNEPFISEILVSAQHLENTDISEIKNNLNNIIKSNDEISKHISPNTIIKVNPCGDWHIGGPISDCGITGRKIVVDHYGGYSNVGGGNLHGKDFSKVDRSGAYFARYLAKNIVAAGLAKEAKVEMSFTISESNPSSINIELTDGVIDADTIVNYIKKNIGLTVNDIIKKVYTTDVKFTAITGHWNQKYPWETIDIDNKLKELLKN